ncbi:CBS domain-containing protein [Anaerobacillus sp. CMMVII]|uniref:CBS domain-containing protein n=1 Tax=Anaerobacillus sp. CMMVII TaxID=2755588 RepID=UPI0021B7AF96|nr:CBS domain-containing protein [Anaerobacillus sp. CMMVII]MCT8137974.1 CBS domain-containing protein [Anaerobacillus sp. CMMVII]
MNKATTISVDDTIVSAARRLRSQTSTGLVVVDNENRLIGTVTQRDLLHVIVSGETNKLVKDIMNKRPYWATVDSFSYDVLSYFKDDHVDFIPVLRQDKVVGTLTAESFLQLQDSNYVNLTHGIDHAVTLERLVKFSTITNRLFIDLSRYC